MSRMRSAAIVMAVACLWFAVAVQGEQTTYKAPIGSDGVQRIEMAAGEFFFNPSRVIVKVNVPVELRIKKEPSLVPHRIVLKAPEAGIDIYESLSSEPKIITFTPKKTGTYPFYCDHKFLFFKSHRDRGMEGVLEVVE
ncbi:MAG: cupredoxin domain-containing protein [Nitrospirota bacterium]